MRPGARKASGALALGALAAAAPWAAQPLAAQERPTLTPADYGRFESLGRATLSPDGGWIAYQVERVDGADELRIRTVADGTERTVPFGAGPAFSGDGRWLAWSVGVSEEERERREAAGEPVRDRVTLLDLATGEERALGEAPGFAFEPGGRFLALPGYAPEEPEGAGADLRVIELATSTTTTFGNVTDHAWSDAGSMLAMTVASEASGGDGVQVYAAGGGRLWSLDASDARYVGLSWREGAPDLVVLRTEREGSDAGTAHRALAWREVGAEAVRRFELDPAAAGLPDTLEVVAHAPPRWSEDGLRVALGLRPAGAGEEEDGEVASREGGAADRTGAGGEGSGPEPDAEPADVQIWHTADVRLVPEQAASAARDGRRTLLAVWSLDDGRLVRLGGDLMEGAELLEGWRHAVERDADPYPWGARFGRPYHDVWLIDATSGARARVLERVRHAWASPAARWLVWFDGRDFWSHEIATGVERNLTAGLPAAFADTAWDTPTDLLPPHGVGGWLEDDAAVLLYDEHDVWRVAPDGSGGERLTRGAEEEVVHRLVRVDRDQEAFPAGRPLYLALRGEWTERTGYARLLPGEGVERLLLEDRRVASLQRADSADVYAFTMEGFDDSRDWFVAGPDLARPRRVTDTNPFLGQYAWGRSELVEFESEAGRRLQGALFRPAAHDPGRRYPMIVYTYEILAPRVHGFVAPSERDYYNVTAWTQQGYLVLMPDIVYRWGDPGVSALEAVRPAVARVVEMGLADPARVGLIGHSWGGYQATYLPTRTDLFAASVAGAPLTDFVSMMGAIHWNPGIAELSHWETGQARMEVPFWEDPEGHRRNSPIHGVQDLDTPLLMAFGDQDGVVDFDQGTEFYNFARRAGKQMVLLVYEGEDHGLREEANQRDYHRRILEWFGHYLKGEPAPRWIVEGVPLGEQEEEARRVAGPGG